MSKRWMLAVCAALAVGAAQADVSGSAGKPTKTAVLDMGPGCRIRLVAPAAARVSGSPEGGGSGSVTVENPLGLVTKRYVAPFWLPFICHDADQEGLSESAPVRYDGVLGAWHKDMQKLYALYTHPDEAFRRTLDRAVRVYDMTSVNAQGFAFTLDDVIGDERGRLRHFRYCLFKGVKAICGQTHVGLLVDIRRNPRHDLTTYALKILRSIEFIDEAAAGGPLAPR